MDWTGVLIGLAIGVVIGIPLVYLELKRQIRRARAAERRARTAERLAEIGAMTGGLAHEIKNPLSTIGLNAQLLSEAITDLQVDEQDKGRLVRRIDALRREADRLGGILHDFLRFAGEMKLDLRPNELNQIIDELADFYLPQAEHNGVSIRAELGAGPMPAMVDAPQLKQALLNLMINATQAMAGDASGRSKELILRTESGPAFDDGNEPSWRIHVIDTGPGIPAETRDQVFTPYFTTKSGGTGLGLPTTRRIVEEHGGVIAVHSEPGTGSDFTIDLPRGSPSQGTPAQTDGTNESS